MVTLNNSQEKILKEIKNSLEDRGYPPTVRELCNSVGLKSKATVHYHLTKLEKLGYIKREYREPRAITVLK